ncbi:MAG: hypothetical protein Q8N06_02845 [Hydrogenophaga sp.]|nr:hypothetical protein [Hydrogenophaga sp.]
MRQQNRKASQGRQPPPPKKAWASADEGKVQAIMMTTWLPVAAIAAMAGIPTKTALALLQQRCDAWALECRRVRIDGKNLVHCFRKRDTGKLLVLGVWLPVRAEPEIEEA